MDINKLLGGVDCACQRRHTCDIKYVYIEKDATARIEQVCKDKKSVLVVADENTFFAAGEKTLAHLRDKSVKTVIFKKELLVPNETAIDEVSECLEGCELIVGVGSGVIQDLCKYVSYFNKIPYIIVATAPSMDGYASSGAAMITGGMKTTFSAGLPLAIIGDTEVLKNAPIDMIKAGFGDIVGKFSALNDWRLSHLINGECFCQYIYDTTFEQITKTLSLADGILKREEKSIKALMEALVVIGIMMSFAGSSRPASGSEHHLSHFFEITGIIDAEKYLPHGIDVAYSTVVTSELRERLVHLPFPKAVIRKSKEEYEGDIRRLYKEVADGCIELQERIGSYKTDRANIYLEKEAEIKEILSDMPSSSQIKEMLALVGLDMREFYDFYGEEKIQNAILYAKDLKDRYTVLWLYYDFFGDKNK